MRIAGLLLIALFLGGCGGTGSNSGDAKSSYEHAMAAVAPPLQEQLLKARFALEETRIPARGQAQVARLEARLRLGIRSLAAITPPGEISAEHAQLIDAYRGFLADVEPLGNVARAKTTDSLRVDAAKAFGGSSYQAIGPALQAIIAKGYDLGFPPGS